MAQPISTYFNINKTTSSTASSQQQTKPKINLFDFKTTQSVQPTSFSQFVQNKTSTPQNIMNFWPWVSQKWVTNVNEYNPVTKRTENIFTPKPTTTEQSSWFSLIPTANASNDKMSLQEFWEMIKTKYPDYSSIDSVELWKKMIEKYPIYSNKVDISWQITTQPQEEQWFFESIKYKPYTQEELTSYDPNKTTTQNILEWQWKYAKNIAGWLYNIIPWVAEMWTNLVTWTAKDVWMKVWNLFWLVSNEDKKAYEQALSDKTGKIIWWVAKDYATKYWSVEWFKNAVMTDPTAIVWDALSVVWIWIAWKSKLTNIQKSALETQKSNIINQVKNATTLEEKSALIKQWIEASKQIAEKTKQVKTLEVAQWIVNKYNPYIQAPVLATKWVIKWWQMFKKTWEVVASPLNPVINQAKTLISKPNEIQGIQQAIKPYVKVRDWKVVRSDNQIKSEIQTANNYVNNSWIQQTSLATYRQALEKSLKWLWAEISARTKQPLEIDLSDTAWKLRELASKKTVWVLDKWGQQQILNIADDLEKWKLSVEEAEFMNQYINDELWNIPSASESLKRAKQILVQDIRTKLDATLSNIPWEFKQLKKDYWALRNVLWDTIKREIVYNRQNPEWLITSISKIEWLSDVWTWLIKTITWSPKEWLTQVWQWILKNKVWAYIKTKNDPNEIIKNIFSNKVKNDNNVNPNISSISKNNNGISEIKQQVSNTKSLKKPILSDKEKALIKKTSKN